MAVAQDATGVPREWLVQLGSGWYAFIGTSGVAFALATTYACSQFLHRTLELSRAAKRSRSVAARSGGCTTEYRRLMMGLSTVALALRTLWHLDPASFEGILPRAVSFLLLRVPQCVLFLQALFVVAFTRRFTISMLKLSRIKSKITVGRYKYVFAVVAVLLVVAVACGFVGSLGTLATPLHLAEQGIFASVAVFTTTAGFVFARGFRAATSSTGAPSPVATQSPLTLPPGRSKALPAPPRAAAQPPGGAQAAAPASDAAGAVTRAASAPDAASDGVGGDGRWANPIVRLSRSFRMSFRSSRSIFSSASGSGFGSGSPTQAGQGQSVRARRGSRMAAQMQGAVFVGIAGAVGMGAALAWSVATGLPTPQEWLSFTALFRALELVLASSALYTVASARNRLARPVCPYHLLDFALCVWWPQCPCPRKKRLRPHIAGEAPGAPAAVEAAAAPLPPRAPQKQEKPSLGRDMSFRSRLQLQVLASTASPAAKQPRGRVPRSRASRTYGPQGALVPDADAGGQSLATAQLGPARAQLASRDARAKFARPAPPPKPSNRVPSALAATAAEPSTCHAQGADCLPADSQVGAVGGGIDGAELLDGSDRKRAPSGTALSESDGAGSSSDECDSESDGSDSDSARGTRLPRMPRVSVLSWTAEKS